MACLPELQRYVGEFEAPTFVTFCELNFMGGGYGPALYRIDCVGIVAWSYRSLLRRHKGDLTCKIWYSISQTVSDLVNIYDRSIRAFAVKPRAFGAQCVTGP